MDEADDVFTVVLDIEVVEGEVAADGVARVPGATVVVSVHGESSAGEAQVAVGGKEVVQDLLLVGRREKFQGIEVQLVEAGAPGPELVARLQLSELEQGAGGRIST